MALIIFWGSFAVLVYVYLVYPALLWILPKKDVASSDAPSEDKLPAVSLIVAAYNEEEVIEEKVRNCLALDYPKDRLEIWIASDGSTDRTNEILGRYEGEGINVNYVAPRGGKTRALNLTVPLARGEIIVFSDANTMYQPDALRKLVRHFRNPSVGGVSGDVRLMNQEVSFGQSEGLYYRYERFIQAMESQFHSIIGVDGAMYAIRKELFVPPSNNIILDDFVISMSVAAKGFRVLYDPEAVATETATPNSAQEFRRKMRISAGAMQSIRQREGLPGFGDGKLLFAYLSHKLLRWWSPFFLLGLYFSNLHLLKGSPGFILFFGLQSAAYVMALRGVSRNGGPMAKPVEIAYFFALQNAAYLLGGAKGLLIRQGGMWERTAR